MLASPSMRDAMVGSGSIVDPSSLRRDAVRLLVMLFAALTIAAPSSAQIDARMLRQPAVSATQIAFVYAGDIWLVPENRRHGDTPQLASWRRVVSAIFAGWNEARVQRQLRRQRRTCTSCRRQAARRRGSRTIRWPIASSAGIPTASASSLPRAARADANATTSSILSASRAACPRNCRCRTANSARSLPTASSSSTCRRRRTSANWKRYRGGWAPDLWLFDLTTFAARNITNNPANDAQPMWHGNTIYFLSDRGANERNNIWADDLATGRRSGRSPISATST